MANFTETTNYSFKKPTVGADTDQWGTHLNETIDGVDSQLKTLADSITSQQLEQLGNVVNVTPTDDQFLRYNGTNWTAETVSIPSVLNDLSNVSGTPSSGDVLTYNGSAWSPASVTSAAVADGSVTNAKLHPSLQTVIGRILVTDDDDSPTDNQILVYSTSDAEWKYADQAGSTLQTLTDVSTTGLSDGDLMKYDGTAGEFVFIDAAAARTLLSVDVSGTDNSTPVSLNTTSHDYLILSSQEITLGPIVLTDDVSGTLPIANGGTSATTAAGARTALGLSIGTNIQAYSVSLQDISSLAKTDGNIIVGNGTNWVAESGATARASLGLTIGSDVEAYSSTNADYGDVTSNFTGTLQNGGSNVLVDSDIGSSVQAYDADTAKYDDTTANFTGTLQNGGSNVLVDSDIGSTVQAAGSYLSDVVNDTTPQLGGSLDVNGQSIVSVSAGNIAITPDTTGKIILDGLSWPTTDGSADQVLKTDGAGNLSFVNQSGGGGGSGSYIEHSPTISDSLAISSGTNRMYIGNTSFSGGGVTMAGYLVISHGYANFTGAFALNVTGILNAG